MTLMDEHGAAKATGASGGLNSYPVLKTGPLSRRHRMGQYFLPTLGITFNKGVSHCRLRTRLKTTRPYGCCGRNSKVPPIHGRPAHPRDPARTSSTRILDRHSGLQAILPAHRGPTATVPVTLDDEGTQHQNGVDAKDAVLRQLDAALRVIDSSGAERILTLGGECSVSVGPFASLAAKYGEDLAIVWVDSHPDVGTPDSDYPGYHAMAVSVLSGTATATS